VPAAVVAAFGWPRFFRDRRGAALLLAPVLLLF